jgi:hypothetical protein
MAQNVYSLNVVGYINLSLTNGLNLIANQLDFDGTLTNNTLFTVFGTNTLPNATKVAAWQPSSSSFITAAYSATSGKWNNTSGQPYIDSQLAPGAAVFVSIPTSATTPVTLTLVGQVIQGTNTTVVTPGLGFYSAIPPISGGLVSTLGFPAQRLDKFQAWNAASQSYLTKAYSGSAWNGTPAGEPQLSVGEGFGYTAAAATATNWIQAFTVQ